MEKENLKYLIIASHRRSGTHWLIDTLFNNFEQVQHGYTSLDRIVPGSEKYVKPEGFLDMIDTHGKVRILKTHTPGGFQLFNDIPEKKEIIDNGILPFSKILYVYRDCRDVMLSLFFFVNSSRKFDIDLFNLFLREPHDLDRIEEKMNRLEFHKYHVESWLGNSEVLFVKYEDLHFSVPDVLEKVGDFTGMKLRKDPVNIKLKKYNKIQRGLRRIFPGIFRTTAVLPRKGIVGDWKNHCNDDILELYEKYCGEFLSRLGYGKY